MNLSKIMTNATGQLLHEGPYEAFKDFFDGTMATDHSEEVVQQMENACKKVNPTYRSLTPEEKAIRKAQHERALEIVPRVAYDTLSASKGYSSIGISRSFYSVVYGLKDTPADNAKKEQIVHAYKEGTAQERHDIFLGVMNELADFDLDEYRSMNMDQKLDRLPTILPTLYKAMESEKLLDDFKSFDCGITPEEEQRFTTLYKTLHGYAAGLFDEMSAVIDPYYADLDLKQLNYDKATTFAIMDELEEQGYFQGSNSIESYSSFCETLVCEDGMIVTGEVFDEFRRNGVNLDFGDIKRCTPEVTAEKYDDDKQYTRALQNGETLYFVNNKTGSNHEMLAVHDVYGKGYPTVITMEQARELEELQARKPIRMAPVPKPNIFVRFFDSINRAFGGKGFDSVNEYNRYVRDCESFDGRMSRHQAEYRQKLEKIKPTTADRGYTDAFNKAAKEAKAAQKALKADQELKTRGKAFASSYMLEGKLTPEQAEWAKENPDAFRDGFARIKEDIIAQSGGKLAEDAKEYLAELDTKVQAAFKALESKDEMQLTNSSVRTRTNEEKPENPSLENPSPENPSLQKSAPRSVSLP